VSERETPETDEKFAQELAEDWLVVNGICERKNARVNKYAALRTAYVDGYFRYKDVYLDKVASIDDLAEALRMFLYPGKVTHMDLTKARELLARIDAENERGLG